MALLPHMGDFGSALFAGAIFGLFSVVVVELYSYLANGQFDSQSFDFLVFAEAFIAGFAAQYALRYLGVS